MWHIIGTHRGRERDLEDAIRKAFTCHRAYSHAVVESRPTQAQAIEVGSRRILHVNVTEHPTAEWTTQQFREFLAFDYPYRFVIHDRDAIFSPDLNAALEGFGVRVLPTPVRAPKANAYCERLVGTIRRECLDFLIPLSEAHLRRILREYVRHYNRGRPHSSLGPTR